MIDIASLALDVIDIFERYGTEFPPLLDETKFQLEVCKNCGDIRLRHNTHCYNEKYYYDECRQNNQICAQKIFKKDLEKSQALLAILRVLK